jgi:hypothetical protein
VILFVAYGFENSSPRDLDGSSRTGSGSGIAAITFVHTALFLFPAISIALPRPSPHGWGNSLFIGFSLIINTWVALFFVLFQFYPQYLELRRKPSGITPGALSLLSLGLQSGVILAVGVRWLLRLGEPAWIEELAQAPAKWRDRQQTRAPLWLWYKWGEVPFSYLLHAIGCAILLAAYLVTKRGNGSERDARVSEEAPLLA